MQLILSKDDYATSQDCGEPVIMDVDVEYYWMCGVCEDKPKFHKLDAFLDHKLIKHVRSIPLFNVVSKIEAEFESEDEIPLSVIKGSCQPKTEEVLNKDSNNLENSVKEEDLNLLVQLQLPQSNDEDQKDSTINENTLSNLTKEIQSDNDDFYWDDDIFDNSDDKSENNSTPVNNKIVRFICKVCDTECESRAALSKHKTTHMCPETREYQCLTCGKMFPKFDNFIRHLDIHKDDRTKDFRCVTCSANFYNPADLKRHCMLHMEVKPYTCGQCNEGFTRHDALLGHMSKHTGVPYVKYTCKVCGKVYHSPSALAMHSKNHTDKTVFCTEPGCQFSCYLQSQLRQHLRTHNGEKPYQCAQCGRCFARNNDMKNHVLNIHEKLRPFKCPDCPREFPMQSSLKTHRLVHLEVKPYLCALCGKGFNHPSSLRKHSSIAHPPGSQQNQVIVSEEKYYSDVAVQATPMSVVPVTIHIPHIGLTLDQELTQAYVISTITETSTELS